MGRHDLQTPASQESRAREHVLCVDDEPQVLKGLALHLGRHHHVITATSGAEALGILERDPSIAVVISDMRMPGMNGAAFLAQARRVSPRASRILLTGETDLTSAIAAVNEGQIQCFLTKPCTPVKLHEAVEAAIRRHHESNIDQSSIRRNLVVEMASRDPLTGLASRSRFHGALADACGEGKHYALFILKLGNLREINAAHGHGAGDHVIITLAQRLRQQCAESTPDCIGSCERCGICGRWSDDEFAMLRLRDNADPSQLTAAADILLGSLTTPIIHKDALLHPRIGIGITHIPTHTRDADVALKNASLAAHEARLAGMSSSCLFQPELARKIEQRFHMLSALREAIDTNALRLHYQPIVDLAQGQVRAFEALARWHHPEFGEVPPMQFITLAEQSGDMPRLGQWVLRRACLEARKLLGRYAGSVAVNVSMQQLLGEGFLTHVDDALRISGLPPQALELELTESVLSQDTERVLAILHALRARGVRVAIDDFGTGYSSLAYLQQLPAGAIKVDRHFTNNLDKGGETILTAALSIGRSFGMEVVVEGVETSGVLQQLRALGVSVCQGYLFARPMPAAEIPDWFATSGLTAAPTPMMSEGMASMGQKTARSTT